MSESRDQGAIPQGLIEQARAKDVDPGHLQMLGKQAAALYGDKGVSLSDAVVQTIGDEDLGPEHARRVCEFANQSAFQGEWEKGGSVRNVEFDGGPADPAYVLREMNDGARQPPVRTISDYDSAPTKIARADSRVDHDVFGKYAQTMHHPSEVPSAGPDLNRLRQTMSGAQDHFTSKISGLEITKEALARELGEVVSNAVLEGDSLYKIASAWSHFSDNANLFKEALDASIARMQERGMVVEDIEPEKIAEPVGKIPNPQHPLISRFVEFTKTAKQLNILRDARASIGKQMTQVNQAMAKHASFRAPMVNPAMAMMPGMANAMLAGRKR